MDAVVLAAGRGTRVRDLAPEFHKPLLPIDGVPLICRAVDLALTRCELPTVVVAPENAEAISGTLEDRQVTLVVQRRPWGPGDALATGLQVGHADRVLVLLSDNVSTYDDVVAVTQHVTAIGVKELDHREAERFTKYVHGKWIEKQPDISSAATRIVWVGPFVGWRKHMERVLWQHRDEATTSELLIGPYLAEMMTDDYVRVNVSSYDVGTLESYPPGGLT